MKKPHAHLQTYIKMCVKFQKNLPKTVRRVALTRKHENVTDRQTDGQTREKTICLLTPLAEDIMINAIKKADK